MRRILWAECGVAPDAARPCGNSCGFRRSELVGLESDEIQMRQGHRAAVDLIGKGGHIRTVPIPNWVKAALDQWTQSAGVFEGKIFRAVAGRGKRHDALRLLRGSIPSVLVF